MSGHLHNGGLSVQNSTYTHPATHPEYHRAPATHIALRPGAVRMQPDSHRHSHALHWNSIATIEPNTPIHTTAHHIWHKYSCIHPAATFEHHCTPLKHIVPRSSAVRLQPDPCRHSHALHRNPIVTIKPNAPPHSTPVSTPHSAQRHTHPPGHHHKTPPCPGDACCSPPQRRLHAARLAPPFPRVALELYRDHWAKQTPSITQRTTQGTTQGTTTHMHPLSRHL